MIEYDVHTRPSEKALPRHQQLAWRIAEVAADPVEVADDIGFDTPMFTPLFVASRITGWTAHVMEQAASNALIRPLSAYDGASERHLPAMPQRRPELV